MVKRKPGLLYCTNQQEATKNLQVPKNTLFPQNMENEVNKPKSMLKRFKSINRNWYFILSVCIVYRNLCHMTLIPTAV